MVLIFNYINIFKFNFRENNYRNSSCDRANRVCEFFIKKEINSIKVRNFMRIAYFCTKKMRK